MFVFFVESIRSGKINYQSVISYLERTWFNDPIIKISNGKERIIIPLEMIKPALKRIFGDFNNAEKDPEYICDFVTVIDSLILKIEGILRFFIERLKIPTSKLKRTKTGDFMMEKLLDDIIADLEDKPGKPTGFDEDLRILIKYVMTEKAGWNLRNDVAHSLLQIEDYTPEKIVVLFCLILKLSKYTFVEKG